MLLPLSYKPEATYVSNVHMITYGSCAFSCTTRRVRVI